MSDSAFEFDWDATKAAANLAKHRVDFAQASTVLNDPLAITVFDEAHSQSEERWFTLGMSNDGQLLAVSHTYEQTTPSRAQVRIISARKATRQERKDYEQTPR